MFNLLLKTEALKPGYAPQQFCLAWVVIHGSFHTATQVVQIESSNPIRLQISAPTFEFLSYMGTNQWSFYSRNIVQVTPKIIYFHYLQK